MRGWTIISTSLLLVDCVWQILGFNVVAMILTFCKPLLNVYFRLGLINIGMSGQSTGARCRPFEDFGASSGTILEVPIIIRICSLERTICDGIARSGAGGGAL